MAETQSDVAAMLPMLRRYARAFAGKPALGDHYFRICLELIVEDPRRLSSAGDLNNDLCRLFHHVWSRANPLEVMHRSPRTSPGEGRCRLGPPASKIARPPVRSRESGITIH